MSSWRVATLKESHMTASDVMSLTFTVDEWEKHSSGQHYEIRLTAPDGYQAGRDYSIASAPEDQGIVEFGVQLLPGGEVSPYLFALKIGEQVEINGPLGGHFLWDVSIPGPLILIGGGSGMVPLMSMLRHHTKHDDPRDILFFVSARSLEKVLYLDEITNLTKQDPKVKLVLTLTDNPPQDWQGYARRVDKPMLEEELAPFKSQGPNIYICGPTPFVEVVASNLVELQFPPEKIKTERFGG